MTGLTLAIVGATGMVGREALQILENRPQWPVSELRLFATAQSAGTVLKFKGQSLKVLDIDQEQHPFRDCHAAFFCVDNAAAKKLAPKAIADGCWVVDNSSAHRMDTGIPLVVPTVNGALVEECRKRPGAHVIANPNCSTIQLVMPLKALHTAFGLEDVVLSSYQSASGAGRDGLDALMTQTREVVEAWAKCEDKGAFHRTEYPVFKTATQGPFPRELAFNLFPQIGNFGADGFCEEEQKIMRETKKILDLPSLPVAATVVRVPVLNVHSESVTVTLKSAVKLEQVVKVLMQAPGVQVAAAPEAYPTPRAMSGSDVVMVGRLRMDPHHERRVHFWVVADNLRIGAALNGMDIVESIIRN